MLCAIQIMIVYTQTLCRLTVEYAISFGCSARSTFTINIIHNIAYNYIRRRTWLCACISEYVVTSSRYNLSQRKHSAKIRVKKPQSIKKKSSPIVFHPSFFACVGTVYRFLIVLSSFSGKIFDTIQDDI